MASGAVRCEACGDVHRIESGILGLVAESRLHPESIREMTARDRKNTAILSGARAEWSSAIADAIEVRPTLEAVGAGAGMVVLELGCGPGRYTLALAASSDAVVAVDFSQPGLLLLRDKLPAEARVALLRADVTKPFVAPRAFDRALSTLHSNLPDAAHRAASLHYVAQGLTPGGRAVFSMHHLSGRDRLMRVPAAGRYPDSGVFRYYMRRDEARREGARFFSKTSFVYINAGVPGLRSVTAARLAARLPLVRVALARLVLAVSERPRDPILSIDSAPSQSATTAR